MTVQKSPRLKAAIVLPVLLFLLIPITVQARDKTANEWLKVIANSSWDELAQVTDSLVATITNMEELERIELAFTEARSKARSPWDEIRWQRRLGMASSRINEALSRRRVAGSLLEADAFASRAVEDYPYPSAIGLYGEILIKEERISEAVGLLLSGSLMTDNHDLEVAAKNSFDLWTSSRQQWEDFRKSFADDWVEMNARKAKADASMRRSDGSGLCNITFDINDDNPYAVLVLWDEYPGSIGESVLRDLSLFLRSEQLPHEFCFAGMEKQSAGEAASRIGIPWNKKNGRISSAELQSAGIGELPAFIVLDDESNIVAHVEGENRKLADVLRSVLEDLDDTDPEELETGELR